MVVCSTPAIPAKRTEHQFEVMHNVDRDVFAMRMLARLKNGKVENANFHPGPLTGNPAKGFVQIFESEFKPEDVNEYVLERTPWVRGEIKGIALKPTRSP
jgi:hypothetical protein